jgi:predicted O-methyltransferase YrrM
MTSEKWTAVDDYVNRLLIPADAALDAAQRAATDAGLPPISVSAAQGKLLHLLVRISGARRILEVGTLAGYSTIWMARALPPGGRIVSLEFDPKHADIARANVDRAGLSGVIEIRVGRAIDALPKLASEAPFDFIFIDADKPSTLAYFEWAVKLSRPGTVIIVDNVVRDGALVDEPVTDENIKGMRRFLAGLASETRADGTVIQTVGAKGYDGFAIAIV